MGALLRDAGVCVPEELPRQTIDGKNRVMLIPGKLQAQRNELLGKESLKKRRLNTENKDVRKGGTGHQGE